MTYADRLNTVNGTALAAGPGSLPARTWTLLTITVVNATALGTFYINGVQQGSGTVTAFPVTTWQAAYLGRSQWGGDGYFNGFIGSLQIYPAALSAQDVENMYAGVQPVNPYPPLPPYPSPPPSPPVRPDWNRAVGPPFRTIKSKTEAL